LTFLDGEDNEGELKKGIGHGTHTHNQGKPVPEEAFTHSHLSWSWITPEKSWNSKVVVLEILISGTSIPN